MANFKVSLLLCAVGVALAQVQPNLNEERELDVNRAGFPGGRPLLPGNRHFQHPLGLGASAAGVGVVNNVFENNGDGNFRWGFETADGTRSEQTGFFKLPDPVNPEGSQAVQGSYSYISPEGIPITVNYVADENGFRAVGDHIPSNGGNTNANLNLGLGQFGQPGLGLGANGLRVGLNNRVVGNDLPLGAPVPTPSPAVLAAAGGLDSFGRPIPVSQTTAAAAAAATQAALLRNPGAVRPGSPADLEFLAQQESLRLRNPFNNKINPNFNNNRFGGFPFNNNFNGRFQNQNQLSLINGPGQNPAFNPAYGGRGVGPLGGK